MAPKRSILVFIHGHGDNVKNYKPILSNCPMATCNKERNRFNYGKELPPITLSNTSISSLVSLIPVLVALTSRAQNPCFDNEKDKPAWWPDDIQWKNPKHYSAYMGDSILKLLRKVVHSCYSYHGVEDLLCRLDETPLSSLEVVDISDDGGERESILSTDNEGPVFVCCFCLEEFSSHEKVSAHQQLCQEKSHDSSGVTKDEKLDGLAEFSLEDFPHPVSLTNLDVSESRQRYQTSNSNLKDGGKTAQISSSSSTNETKKSSSTSSSKRQPANTVVPILKTRSQKKLDQIMDRHNKRQLMIKECCELREVPKSGAWWVMRRKQEKRNSPDIYPNEMHSKQDFLSNLGLTFKLEAESQQNEKDKKEVDLDCEIICVEGPLSSKPPPIAQDNSNSLSPRGSRSLMSQLTRDEDTSRRRISFCFVEDEWADKEALEEGRDPLHLSLLTLDLSSPLGQRIKKYVKADGQMNVVKDLELHCKTDSRDENKLRVRVYDYKVTYRRKCRASSYVHSYKFNKFDMHEYKRQLQTGLNFRSRRLLKIMPRCKVVLKNLTDKDIELFNAEKRVTIAENIMVDDDLCITQIDLPESLFKSNNTQHASTSSSSHPMGQKTSSHSSLPSHLSSQQRHHPYHIPPHLHRKPSLSRGAFSPRPYSLSHRPNHSPSPPHIPNIFRNRSGSNTPSPTKLTPGHKADPRRFSQSDFKNALQKLQSQHQHNQHPHRPQHHQHQHRPQHHHPQHSRFPQNQHRHPHHPQHPQNQQRTATNSPPSGFSSGVIISEIRGPVITSNNRRKQLLNQVRHDDYLDKNSPRNSHKNDEARNFVNLANASSVYKSQSSSSQSRNSTPSSSSASQHGRDLKKAYKPQDLSKLSNFEYFSIKQGKLLPGHSLSSSLAQRRPPTVSHSHQPSGQNSSIPSQNKLPLTSQRNSTIVPNSAFSSQRRSAVPSVRNTPDPPPAHSNVSQRNTPVPPPAHSNVSQRNSMNHQHREIIRQGPKIAHVSGASESSVSIKPSSCQSNLVDDDIMEVICIDD